MGNLISREMLEFLVMISNFFIALCMGFYTLDCFWAFKYREESTGGILYIRQNFWMFVIQFLSFFNLAYISKEWNYVLLYIALQLFFVVILCITPLIYRTINRLLLNNMCMMFSVSMVALARLSIDKAIRQFEIMGIAYVLCMFIPLLLKKTNILPKLKWTYAIIGTIALGSVLLLSETTYGSKLSFTIEGFTFQPSEFVKIFFVLFLAAALSSGTSLLQLLITSLIAGAHVLILVLSTDLGSALIFFITYLAMIFVSSRNYLYLLLGIGGGCGASFLAFHLFTHVRTRVLAWSDPWSYIDNKGYQITQSLFAIGSGSWFGMGLYKGVPDDIPFVETDFIFSSICEEFGTIFGILLILVIISCFMMMIRISLSTQNKFYRLTAFGYAVLYIFQVFLTVGGGIKFIPLTGVTLPLISYGGSSLVSVMIMFFLLHSIHMQSQSVPKEINTASEELIDIDLDEVIDLDENEDDILEMEEESNEKENDTENV